MELKRVVVTGLGAITPIGNTVPEFWENLVNGVSGAGPITHFDASLFKTQFACEVKNFDANQYIDRKEARKMDLYTQYAIGVAKQAVEDKVESLTIGADDYVTKPFNVEVLILRMRKLIDLYGKRRQRLRIEPEPSRIVITSLDEQLVADAIKYVEANIGRSDLSVEELSRELGMSRVHLYKKLSQITGKTPIEFIRIIRLKRAAQLLRESQRNVSEIAYQLGFNNPKYFSKYFRDEFGVLPSVYQEREGK